MGFRRPLKNARKKWLWRTADLGRPAVGKFNGGRRTLSRNELDRGLSGRQVAPPFSTLRATGGFEIRSCSGDQSRLSSLKKLGGDRQTKCGRLLAQRRWAYISIKLGVSPVVEEKAGGRRRAKNKKRLNGEQTKNT